MTSATACDVPLAGFVVTDIWFSGHIRILACRPNAAGGPPLEIQLWFRGPLTFRDETGRIHDLDARDPWEFLISLFELRHQVIESAMVDESGRIQICFELGQALAAEAHAQCENWGMVGLDGLNLVALPHGWADQVEWPVLRSRG